MILDKIVWPSDQDEGVSQAVAFLRQFIGNCKYLLQIDISSLNVGCVFSDLNISMLGTFDLELLFYSGF